MLCCLRRDASKLLSRVIRGAIHESRSTHMNLWSVEASVQSEWSRSRLMMDGFDPFLGHQKTAQACRFSSLPTKNQPSGEREQDRSATVDDVVNQTLQSICAVDFTPHLEMLKKTRSVMMYDEFIQEFHEALPYANDDDAYRICDALATSGSIIKSGDMVYLRPLEIARSLRSLLPVDVPSLEKRLAVVRDKLEPMERIKSVIEQEAQRRNTKFNMLFLGLLAGQWGIFFRLCYWELSWDVVEPLGFFANGLTTLLSFAWFLRTRRDFSYEGMSDTVTSAYAHRKLTEQNFNFVEYERLTQEANRLEEALNSIKARVL